MNALPTDPILSKILPVFYFDNIGKQIFFLQLSSFLKSTCQSSEIHNIDAIQLYLYRYWFTRHIISVIKRINNGFLNRLIWIIHNSQRFHLIWNLNYLFSYNEIPKTFHCCLNHLRHRTSNIGKIFTNTWIFYTPFRKGCHLNINIWKKPVQMFTKHQMVIQKCKLSNRYLQTKHSSEQMYCSRIYKKTLTTCSKVGVRYTYKEKLFQHPIHQEFTKPYNKPYGQIQRGKVPNNTPLIYELKRLHDEYTKKYEYTQRKDILSTFLFLHYCDII